MSKNKVDTVVVVKLWADDWDRIREVLKASAGQEASEVEQLKMNMLCGRFTSGSRSWEGGAIDDIGLKIVGTARKGRSSKLLKKQSEWLNKATGQ